MVAMSVTMESNGILGLLVVLTGTMAAEEVTSCCAGAIVMNVVAANGVMVLDSRIGRNSKCSWRSKENKMEMVNRVEATEVGDRGRYKESTEVSYTLAHT